MANHKVVVDNQISTLILVAVAVVETNFPTIFGGQGFKFNGQGNPFGNSHQKVKITKNKKE